MVKLAASNIAWRNTDDEAAASILRAAGCTAVEIAPTQWRPDALTVEKDHVSAYRSWWESRGLEVTALQALMYGRPELQLFGDAASRSEFVRHFDRVIGFAEWIGARALVFGSPRNRVRGALSWEDSRDMASATLRQIGTRAAAAGVVVCIEPNPPEYGCDFVTSMSEAVELCRAIDSPGVGVQADVAAMTMVGDDYAASLGIARQFIHHVHISEPNLVEIGRGGSDHHRAAAALQSAGYTGFVSLEMRDAGLTGFERALQSVRSAYADLLDIAVPRDDGRSGQGTRKTRNSSF